MRLSKLRTLLLLAAAVLFAAGTLHAQDVETARPIRVKVPKPKVMKFRGEVLAATSVQMIVRSAENEKVVRTFTYTLKVKEKIDKLVDENRLYQPGDKVEIHHEAGSDVATKIRGKPSTPR
jgi:hypothetical protein